MAKKGAIIVFAIVMYTSYAFISLNRVGLVRPFSIRKMSVSSKFTIACPTSNHIEKLGEKLATILEAGDVLLLQGDLGAGKTTLSRGIIQAKFRDPSMIVTSPSYLLDNTYRYGENDYIHHMDLYRLPVGYTEMGILGIPSIFDSALCLVEWPNRLQSKFMPSSYVDISISIPGSGSGPSNVPIFNLSNNEKDSNEHVDANSKVEGNVTNIERETDNDSGDDSDTDNEDADETEEIPEQLRIVNFTFHGDRWLQKASMLPKLFV